MTWTDVVIGVFVLLWALRLAAWLFRDAIGEWLKRGKQPLSPRKRLDRMIGGPVQQTVGWVLVYGLFVFALFYSGGDWSVGGIVRWLMRGWAFLIVIVMPPGMMLALLLQASRSSSVLAGKPERARQIMFEGALIIAYLFLAFAVVFAYFGLKDTVCTKPPMTCDPHNGWLAIYFTIVTWTTLGYGDVLPDPATYGRAFAAWAAFCGYLIMAFLIAAFVSLAGVRSGPDLPAKDKS